MWNLEGKNVGESSDEKQFLSNQNIAVFFAG